MSKTYDALKRAEAGGRHALRARPADWAAPRDFQIVTVASNKGGVGKTTIATNLAIYLRALREDLPVLLVGFDDQTTLDRMFALEAGGVPGDAMTGVREGSFARVARLGQYGVHYVPSSADVFALKQELRDPAHLRRILLATEWKGLVIIDTKSDFEILTRSAIEASDLVIAVVKDHASLIEAKRIYDLLATLDRPIETARILLSLVDLRIKYREGDEVDVLAHLVSRIRQLGYPLFETFVSRSPKIEALYTNPENRARSILHGAPGSRVHEQMHQLAHDVLRLLASAPSTPQPTGKQGSALERASLLANSWSPNRSN